MLHHIKKLFGIKPKAEVEAQPAPVAEYKVEAPAVSPVSEQATQAVVESIAPAKKKPAAKKAPAKKAPAAKKAMAPKQPKEVC